MVDINPLQEVAIKYKKIKVNNNTYILIPSSPIQGFSMGEDYLAKEKHKIAINKDVLTHEKYLIDGVITVEDLQIKYDFFDPDKLDFLCEYYFEEEKDSIIIVEINGENIKKRKITIPRLQNFVTQEEYKRQNGIPSVVLNETSLNELLEEKDINALKEKLQRLKHLIGRYLELEEEEYVTRVSLVDGKIDAIDTDAVVVNNKKPQIVTNTKKEETNPTVDFTVKGLEDYIKERIFGHDDEIRLLATKIYMNYTAIEGERREKILIVGPTGTGKTETLRVASEYLNIPFKDANTVNLVPEGYVGTSIEDVLYSLLLQTNGDVGKASRGIILLDEFDKLGNAQDELKTTMKEILLKFTEGTTMTFTREKKPYVIDTTNMSKIFAGAFSRVFEKEARGIGFNSKEPTSTKDIKPKDVVKKIKEKGYFGSELLDRIQVPVFYKELDFETRRRILLSSKISEYLMKKQRYERQFGVTLEADDSYVDAIFETLEKESESIRILNNLVIETLQNAEYELCTNPNDRGKRLVLTRKAVENPNDFTLI